MSWFSIIIVAALAVVGLSLLSGVVLILRTADSLSRAVLADLAFYAMIAFYLIYTIPAETYIGYEIAILAAIAGGVLPTLSMSRIITQGRR